MSFVVDFTYIYWHRWIVCLVELYRSIYVTRSTIKSFEITNYHDFSGLRNVFRKPIGRTYSRCHNTNTYGNFIFPKYGYLLRSEEHTSELQSRGHLVCRLLLEKKKKRKR